MIPAAKPFSARRRPAPAPRFYVYDCTQPIGVSCRVRGRLAAHVVAWALTLATRRFHDYGEA